MKADHMHMVVLSGCSNRCLEPTAVIRVYHMMLQNCEVLIHSETNGCNATCGRKEWQTWENRTDIETSGRARKNGGNRIHSLIENGTNEQRYGRCFVQSKETTAEVGRLRNMTWQRDGNTRWTILMFGGWHWMEMRKWSWTSIWHCRRQRYDELQLTMVFDVKVS
jgi:hypothetical protein